MSASCFSFFKSIFDKDGDGQVTPDEVLKTAAEVFNIIIKLATLIQQALNLAGVGSNQSDSTFDALNKVAALGKGLSEQLPKIKIPKNLADLGDLNGDGVVNQDDLISLLTASKNMCDALILQEIQIDDVIKYRGEIQKAIDVLKPALQENSVISFVV